MYDQNSKTRLTAFTALTNAGYLIWSPLLSASSDLVIESPSGEFSKIMVRACSKTDKTPILCLSSLQKYKAYLSQYEFLLVVENNEGDAWLLPIAEVPAVASIRMGTKYDKDKLVNVSALKPLKNAVSSVVKDRLYGVAITEESAQDLLKID
jgi:hypothetical protein